VRVRGRMEEELAAEGKGQAWDIKNGRGGLVDIEFSAQVLQLLHGGSRPQIRTTSTPAALAALAQSGLLERNWYDTLLAAYRFYRAIEGRVRIHSDRPDPRVPRDPEKLASLARRLGYPGRREAGEVLAGEIARTREETRRVWDAVAASAGRTLRKR
jgi:glutamate-ammonia-ligase adenylyltransferase